MSSIFDSWQSDVNNAFTTPSQNKRLPGECHSDLDKTPHKIPALFLCSGIPPAVVDHLYAIKTLKFRFTATTPLRLCVLSTTVKPTTSARAFSIKFAFHFC